MNLLKKNYVPLIRTYIVKEKDIPYGKEEVDNPKKVVELVKRLLQGADREYLIVISVDMKSKPVGMEIVSIGTLNEALVNPREVFKHAILCNAGGIIMVHNHPSGNPEPSNHDLSITKRIKQAGKLLGIELLDHIVFGEEGNFFSMAEENKL